MFSPPHEVNHLIPAVLTFAIGYLIGRATPPEPDDGGPVQEKKHGP